MKIHYKNHKIYHIHLKIPQNLFRFFLCYFFRFKYYALPELFHNKVSKKGIGMDFNDYLCTNKKT